MKNQKKMSAKSIVMVGMFTAVMAVLSQIAIPMPTGVPLTLQTFVVALTGFVLGWKLGALTAVIYLLIGAVGAPVFVGMSGGLGILFGKSGGFIFGFIFMALLCGLGAAKKNKVMTGLLAALGLLSCHLLGVVQFMILSNVSFVESVILVSVPYLIKDAISVVLAYFVGVVLKKALNAANILTYAKEA